MGLWNHTLCGYWTMARVDYAVRSTFTAVYHAME